ncbi:MAG: PilT/PilU family type 4a pilus ATPase [Candidatus Omnitrophica bacterium]|nr:PilT/PilU family type 4a pilus ATPase [Candidatus Omnitrophota bacterium]
MNENFSLVDLFKLMGEKGASDLHLQAGSRPFLRIGRVLTEFLDFPVLTEEYLAKIIREVIPDKFSIFEEKHNLDTAVGIPEVGRFRVNVFQQRGSIALVGRKIANVIPDFESLHLPESTGRIADFLNGLVLVTGATGCGKSSTLAAVINNINKQRKCHILCIEDPIEFLYRNKEAIITQREVEVDVGSFKEALRYVVRQDPDVILIGEIRDEETVKFALRGAETGRLVLGTVHSTNATQTIERILGFFPQNEQLQARKNLSRYLKAVISQTLVPSCQEGINLVPVCEIMFVNQIISKLIAEGMDNKIIQAIKAGVKEEGMQDFEQALIDLINKGVITKETGLQYTESPESMEMKLKGVFLNDSSSIIF